MAEGIVRQLQSKYGSVARSDLSGDHSAVRSVAEAFGYSAEELEVIPAGANMGLSCGNPTAFASLRPEEVVVDLGCGGGLDVFLAATKVWPNGKAIGVDMTPEMIERARQNARKTVHGRALSNVEFHLATIEQLPLPDASVDCVISNCVLNLVPDKRTAFREIYRVLKPGGRLAVSDIALKKPLPGEIARNVLAYIGCIAGAIQIRDYEDGLKAAGFHAVKIVDMCKNLNVYAKIENLSACCSSPADAAELLPVAACCVPALQDKKNAAGLHQDLADLFRKYNANNYAASVQVYAVKKNDAP